MDVESSRWREIEQLYHSVLELDPTVRRRLLERADAEVRREVESLLAQQSGDGILHHSVWNEALPVELAVRQATFSPGSLLGPYAVESVLGEGGMGTVYKARDVRLGRLVAIKVCREQFSARFEQEARAISSLNQSNICTLYDVGPNYLVMELVEGPTLAARIEQGPVPLDECLSIAGQIADAMEAAHERGIVHRDLKPKNIHLKPDGMVKVLDFGLAKLEAASLPAPSPTSTGTILGTASYMSPEQARGEAVDKRADIWAFGVILWEMLTGKRLYDGKTTSDILAAVMRDEPDLTHVPAEVRPLLKRCLEKDPRRRLRDIGDASWILEATPEATGVRRTKWVWVVPTLLLAALAALALPYLRQPAQRPRVITTSIAPPENTLFDVDTVMNPPALSPDGREMVLGAQYPNGQNQLWVRRLDSATAVPLNGTEDGRFPFWAPDNRSVGFFAGGKLKRVDVAGGPAQVLADAPSPRGGSWSSKDVIVFAPKLNGPLQRVSANGGTPGPATILDGGNDFSHGFPWFLPDGRHFLFADYRQPGMPEVTLRIGVLDSAEVKTVGQTNSGAVFANGHLLYLRANTLMAQRFDISRLESSGDAAPLVDHVKHINILGEQAGVFSASSDGLLAYETAAEFDRQELTWFDRSGQQVGTLGSEASFHSVELSPDRRYAVVTRDANIWIQDVARGLATRLTFNVLDIFGIWSPDGKYAAYSSDRGVHNGDLYRKAADGSTSEELLYSDGAIKIPTSWSPDAKFLLFFRIDPKTQRDLWLLPVGQGSGAKPILWLGTPFNESFAKFSPDGRWIIYQSDESGRNEIYVGAFPGPGGKRRPSTAGGTYPRWRADGKEVFYVAPNRMLVAAEISSQPGRIESGTSRLLPITVAVINNSYTYDVSRDGQRFLVATPREQNSSVPLTLIQNWTALLNRL
jgi:serine/threonine protein kinase/Tol biopolymer transport system component